MTCINTIFLARTKAQIDLPHIKPLHSAIVARAGTSSLEMCLFFVLEKKDVNTSRKDNTREKKKVKLMPTSVLHPHICVSVQS